MVIQSDGKIVVAGWTNVDEDDDSETNFAVLRLNTNGSLDNSFNSNGKLQVDFGTYDSYAHALAIQDDGKIVVAGTYDYSDGDSKMVVARLNPNGALDNTFSGDGKYQHTTSETTIDNAWDVLIDANDRIVVGGERSNSNGSGYIKPLMIRLGTTGALDPGFSGDGELSFSTSQDHGGGLRELKLQCDGKIMASGYAVDADDDEDMLLARITSSGSLDDTYSGDGMATLGFGVGNDVARSLTVRGSDQFITVAGTAIVDGGASAFGVGRFRAESGIVPPAPTISFDADECELSASGSGTFSWQNELSPFVWSPYATGNPVSATAVDDYRVRVTATNGCVSPWSSVFELEEPCVPEVGIEEVEGAVYDITAYPNPLSGAVTVKFSLQGATDMRIELHDMLGRNVAILLPTMHMAAGEQTRTLAVPSDLASGNYLLVIGGEAGRATLHIVK